MSEDWPAAHSMDTAWFAVDEAGFVARLEATEAGAVPANHPDEDAASATQRAIYAFALERQGASAAEEEVPFEYPSPEGLGLYSYFAGDTGAAPYLRYGEPDPPLHADELPDELRTALVPLPVRFEDEEELPVAAYLPVVTWDDDPFYEDVDGMARPTIGRESEFWEIFGEVDEVPMVDVSDAVWAHRARRSDAKTRANARVLLLVALVFGGLILLSFFVPD